MNAFQLQIEIDRNQKKIDLLPEGEKNYILEKQIEDYKMGVKILSDYTFLKLKICEIVKKYDLYIESEFNGEWKKMTKKMIEKEYYIKFQNKISV